MILGQKDVAQIKVLAEKNLKKNVYSEKKMLAKTKRNASDSPHKVIRKSSESL